MPRGGWREFDDPGANTSAPRRPTAAQTPAPPPGQRRVRVQRTKAGKGGKTVTVLTGLEMGETEAKALLKRLKSLCGTGGTLRDGGIELQGDQVDTAIEVLGTLGFRPKRAGG